MRSLSAVLATALISLAAPAALGTPAASAVPSNSVTGGSSRATVVASDQDVVLAVARRTSRPVRYDSSEEGTGPWYPAVDVFFEVQNCPPDGYLVWAELRQDGQAAGWTSGSAMGAQERWCDNGYSTSNVGFYSPTLHPGWALAHFWVTPQWDSSIVLDEVTRWVRIPRAHHRLG